MADKKLGSNPKEWLAGMTQQERDHRLKHGTDRMGDPSYMQGGPGHGENFPRPPDDFNFPGMQPRYKPSGGGKKKPFKMGEKKNPFKMGGSRKERVEALKEEARKEEELRKRREELGFVDDFSAVQKSKKSGYNPFEL